MAAESEIYDGVDEEPDMITGEQERLSAETATAQAQNGSTEATSVRSIMEKANDFVTWAEDRSVPIGSIEIQGDSVSVEFSDPVGKEIVFSESEDFQERFVQAVQEWKVNAREKAERYEKRFRALDGLNLQIPDEDEEDEEE
jgi:hypothetical protein